MKQHKYSKNDSINAQVKLLIKQGYRYKRGSKHGALISSDGKKRISIPGTPSDWRASRQFRAEVNRRIVKRAKK